MEPPTELAEKGEFPFISLKKVRIYSLASSL
jgi:hypothetical protein